MRLEDVMAGLFGSTGAPGLDEMRKRRGVAGGGPGYEGIGGALVAPGQMMPFYQGIGSHDFSGAFGRDLGRQGLMSLLAEAQGPALRHFQRQGFEQNMPPGQDQREAIGGPNVAPGNTDTGRALDQPQANQTPGVPQGVARGQEIGQVAPAMPRTQGWRNLAPGYSAAAGWGTDKAGRPSFVGGGVPQQQAGRPTQGGTQGGNTLPGRPQASQNAIGGGGAPVAPAAGAGAGQGSSGGAPSGGRGTGGGGGGGQGTSRGGVSGGGSIGVGATGPSGRPLGVTQAGEFSQPKFKRQARDYRAGRVQDAVNQSRGGGPTSPDAGSGLFYDTIRVAPNGGNNNTPSEMGGGGDWNDTHQGTHVGESPAERQARIAAKVARQRAAEERARMQAAPSADQFAPDPRGTGTEPLPTAGKTKPSRREIKARKGRQI